MAKQPPFQYKNQQFKTLIRKALKVISPAAGDTPFTKEQEEIIDKIPESFFADILAKNFADNFASAERTLLKDYDAIEEIDDARNEKEHFKMDNLEKGNEWLLDALNNNKQIVFLTDNDNDGSMSQSVILRFIDILKETKYPTAKILTEFCRPVGGNDTRGFTFELVEDIAKINDLKNDQEILFITTDNGISNKVEQERILKAYPNAKFIVTDHHNPEPELLVADNDRATIINPHYFKTDYPERYTESELKKANNSNFFREYNISGAHTIAIMFKHFIEKNGLNSPEFNLESVKDNLTVINRISKNSNMLDYVASHPSDKPQKPYEIEKFLKLSPLMNINNSISKLLDTKTEDFKATLDTFKESILDLDVDRAMLAFSQMKRDNQRARLILTLLNNNELLEALGKNDFSETLTKFTSLIAKHLNGQAKLEKVDYDLMSKMTGVSVEEIKDRIENQKDDIGELPLFYNGNTNYLEQLRPYVFSYKSDNEKSNFEETVLTELEALYQNSSSSLRVLMTEMRRGSLSDSYQSEFATINVVKDYALKVFNRKFINNTFNMQNNGFIVTLDSVKPDVVKGSFRSLYNISDILKNRSKIEKALGVNITTPGHEKAAGFILTKKDSKVEFNEAFFQKLSETISEQIALIKKNEKVEEKPMLLSSLNDLDILQKFNRVINGSVSHFDKLRPIIKLDENTSVMVDGNAVSLANIVVDKKYGWLPISINFNGGVVIVPTEMVKTIIERGYKDYIQLEFTNEGVFIAGSIIDKEKAEKNLIDLRYEDERYHLIVEAFKENRLDKPIMLSREDMASSPFFKYALNSEKDFSDQENLIIHIMDMYNTGMMSVVDVEANGLGAAKLNNIGVTSYFIDQDKSPSLPFEEVEKFVLTSKLGNHYLFTQELLDSDKVKEISKADAAMLNYRDSLNVVTDLYNEKHYLVTDLALMIPKLKEIKNIDFSAVRRKDDVIHYNRQIRAEMIAYLVNEKDTLIPEVVTTLTGITNEHVQKYGHSIEYIDNSIVKYFEQVQERLAKQGYQKDGKPTPILLGAHNAPYDSNIARVNLPETYDKVFKQANIYDSLRYSKNLHLAYTDTSIIRFEKIRGKNKTGIPSNVLFNGNIFSSYNIVNFISQEGDGVYPDRTGNCLLEKKGDEFFFIDKLKDEKIKLTATKEQLLNVITPEGKVSTVEFNAIEFLKSKVGDTASKNVSSDEINNSSGLMIEQIPLNYVRSSAQLLGLTKTARNIIDYTASRSENALKIVEVENKYPALSEYKGYFEIFQNEFNPRKNMIDNYNDFKKAYPNIFEIIVEKETQPDVDKKGEPKLNKDGTPKMKVISTKYLETIKGVEPETYREQIGEFLKEFLEKNKNLIEEYADEWIYKAILATRDVNSNDLSKDVVELIAYQTAIPKDIVEEKCKNIVAFKKHYGIQHAVHHEMHVNGPHSSDNKGDILYENPLTFSLFNEKTANPYSIYNGYQQANYFRQAQMDSALTFFFSDHYNEKSLLSTSHSQIVTMDRAKPTQILVQAEMLQMKMESKDKQILTVKPNIDMFQSDSLIYFVKKKGVEITQEQLKEDLKVVSYISTFKQLHDTEEAGEFYISQRDKLREDYENLATRYSAIVDSNSRATVKNIIKKSFENILDELSAIRRVIKDNINDPDKAQKVAEYIATTSLSHSQDIESKLKKFYENDGITKADFETISDFFNDFLPKNLAMRPSKYQEINQYFIDAVVKYVNDDLNRYRNEGLLEEHLYNIEELPSVELAIPLTIKELANTNEFGFMPKIIKRLNPLKKLTELNQILHYDSSTLEFLSESEPTARFVSELKVEEETPAFEFKM